MGPVGFPLFSDKPISEKRRHVIRIFRRILDVVGYPFDIPSLKAPSSFHPSGWAACFAKSCKIPNMCYLDSQLLLAIHFQLRDVAGNETVWIEEHLPPFHALELVKLVLDPMASSSRIPGRKSSGNSIGQRAIPPLLQPLSESGPNALGICWWHFRCLESHLFLTKFPIRWTFQLETNHSGTKTPIRGGEIHHSFFLVAPLWLTVSPSLGAEQSASRAGNSPRLGSRAHIFATETSRGGS